MDKITRDIYVCRDTLPQPISYVAGTNAIPIVLKFRDWTIPSGGTAAIYLTKPSGLIVYDMAEIDADANTVTITPTTQLFAESGSQWGQVQIVDGDTIAATFRLLFLVGENMVDSKAIESTNEYTALEALIAQAQQVVADTTDAIAALQQTVAGNSEDITALASEIGYYGSCATAAATAAKTVTVADGFSLAAGATVRVKFTYANTASSPTLNVNDTGAVAMVMYGTTAMTTYHWQAGAVVAFTFDGTSWVAQQPGDASTTQYGVTKLTDGVTSTN
ncbi:MAG: hypothetical protein LUC89_05830 [Oscillospiraceae bacterium]|nr:hypothetical protein [Oscillospiraceae bacterium]